MPNNCDRFFLFSIRQFESEPRLQFYADSTATFVCSTRPEKCFLYEIAKNEDSLTFTRQRATWLYWRWLRRWLNNFYSPNSESTACKENDFRGWLRKCCSLHKAPLSLYNVSAATMFSLGGGGERSLAARMFSTHEASFGWSCQLKVDRINLKFCSNLITKKTIDTTKGLTRVVLWKLESRALDVTKMLIPKSFQWKRNSSVINIYLIPAALARI